MMTEYQSLYVCGAYKVASSQTRVDVSAWLTVMSRCLSDVNIIELHLTEGENDGCLCFWAIIRHMDMGHDHISSEPWVAVNPSHLLDT